MKMLSSHLLILILGLAGLWLGSDLIVRGAIKIAKRIGFSQTFIGLTILALGTDFPEIMVAINGAIQQQQGAHTAELVVGNIVGSNMAQISLVLGFTGLISVLRIQKKDTVKNGLMLIASTLLLFVTALDGFISPTDGLIMVIFYLVYFLSLRQKTQVSKVKGQLRRIFKKQSMIPMLQLMIGLFIIAKASGFVVDSGVAISEIMGISQMIVGVLLIGLGTSLPELMVSLTAVLKGSKGLSIGNLIGSNIVDILLALGGSAMLGGWRVERSIATFDLAYLLFTSVVVVLFLLTKQKLERKESFLILSLYGVYLSLKVLGF